MWRNRPWVIWQGYHQRLFNGNRSQIRAFIKRPLRLSVQTAAALRGQGCVYDCHALTNIPVRGFASPTRTGARSVFPTNNGRCLAIRVPGLTVVTLVAALVFLRIWETTHDRPFRKNITFKSGFPLIPVAVQVICLQCLATRHRTTLPPMLLQTAQTQDLRRSLVAKLNRNAPA